MLTYHDGMSEKDGIVIECRQTRLSIINKGNIMSHMARMLMLGLVCSSASYAGSMGTVTKTRCSAPYLGFEGSYTWNAQRSNHLNNSFSYDNEQQWGGRFSVGIVRPVKDRLSFTGEFGGGYYGSTNMKNPSTGVASLNYSIDGYDFLVGALYNFNQFDVFGSVGIMAQNYRRKSTVDLGQAVKGGLFSGMMSVREVDTEVLPEVKVGGLYNINDNLGISLAYMHVFGSSRVNNYTINATSSSIRLNGNFDIQNPTLNSILLGLRYTFA